MSTATRVVRTRRLSRPDEGTVAGQAPASTRHGDGMLAFILKAENPESRQIEDPFVAMYGDGLALEPILPPERLLILADESAAHGACLDAKADDAVGRGWLLEDTTAKPGPDAEPAPDTDVPDEADAEQSGGEAEERTHELAELLENITPEFTFDELLWQASWESDAIGWSGWEVARKGGGGQGEIGALYPIPAHTLRMTKNRDVYVQERGGQFRYFARFGSGKIVNALTGDVKGEPGASGYAGRTTPDVGVENVGNEVILFRGYSARSQYYPIPRWVSCIPAIAELTAIREYNVAFFSSGGVVDRIIHATAGDATEAEKIAETIQEELDNAEAGAHLSIVTGGSTGSDVKILFLTPTQGRRDGQFGTRRAELTDEVLMAHKVPGYRVAKAIVGSLGGAPTREMLHAYRTGTVEPKQTLIESRLNQTLFGPNGISLKGRVWRLEDLDWDETELDLNIATRAVEQAVASPDEGRDIMGLGKTGRPEMQAHYYKGVALAEPRPKPGLPLGGNPQAQALEDLRSRAASRLEPVTPEVPPPTNGRTPPVEPEPAAVA